MVKPGRNATSTPHGLRVHLPQKKNSPSEQTHNLSGIAPLDDSTNMVSQRQFDMLKDNFKREFKNVKEEFSEEIELMKLQMAELRQELANVKSDLQESRRNNKSRQRQIVVPNIVKQHLHLAYQDLDIDNQWVVTRPFSWRKNVEVTRNLVAEVRNMELEGVRDDVILAAAKIYFASQKRNAAENPIAGVKRKLTTRRHRLFRLRSKIVKKAGSVADKAIWSLASAAVMSDQESDEEAGGRKKRFVMRRPDWRGAEMTHLVERVDQALGEPRNYGQVSERTIDFNKIPNGALKPQYRTALEEEEAEPNNANGHHQDQDVENDNDNNNDNDNDSSSSSDSDDSDA